MVSQRTRESEVSESESQTEEEKEETENRDARVEEVVNCPECGGTLREDGGERACEDCGLVVEEDMIDPGPEWRAFDSKERNQKSRVGSPTTVTMHDKGLTTSIDWRDKDAYGKSLPPEKRRRMRRMRKWQERIRTKDSSERNLQFALSEIDRMASALGVPRDVREVASVLYRRALEKDLIRGRSIEGVASACLYAACRTKNIPRSLEEIETVSRVERKEIGRTYRYISQELGLKMEPVDPKQYVPRYCAELNLSEAVQIKSKEIIEKTKEAGLLSGKSPTGFAAAAIYAASLLCNEKRTQREVAEVANVTEVTIRNRYQEQIKVLGILD